MTKYLYNNNAATTLASSIVAGDTTLTVAAGTGTLFSSPGAGEVQVATIADAATGLIQEIVLITGRSGDTFTITRAQESTSARDWAAGSTFQNRPTAGSYANFLQQGEAATQAANYGGVATGTANAIVVTLSPSLTVATPGMPIRFVAALDNTSTATFNPGPGAAALVNMNGEPLVAGDIQQNGFYEAFYRGGQYYLSKSSVMVADAGSGGQQGLVPSPPAGATAQKRVLLADGTWIKFTVAMNLVGTVVYAMYDASDNDTQLVADGRAVSRSTYSDLFGVIGTTWGVGDGTTTFNLPDLRSAFIQGVDDTSEAGAKGLDDPWVLGTEYDDQMQGHAHTTLYGDFDGTGNTGPVRDDDIGTVNISFTTEAAIVTDGTNGTPRTGLTTHPRGVAGVGMIFY